MKSVKPNLIFDLLEYEISDIDLEYFKTSIDQGCVKKVNQLSSSKWLYLIRYDSSLLEIEVIYNKNSIKLFQCACGAKSPSKICKHALLAAYWHHLKIHTNESRNHRETLLNKELLQSLTKEDLEYFLVFLTKNNLLNREWVHFFISARNPTKYPYTKYQDLLNRFSLFLNSFTRNPASQTKYKLQLLDEVYQLAFYHYNQSNTEEAIHAILSGITFLHQWNTNAPLKNASKLFHLNEKFHLAISQFILLIIAPQALNKLINLILQIASSDEYQVIHQNSNLYEIIHNRKSSQELAKDLFLNITSKLKLPINIEFKHNLLDYLYFKNKSKLLTYLIQTDKAINYNLSLNWIESRKRKISEDWIYQLYLKAYEDTSGDLKKHCANLISELLLKGNILFDTILYYKFYIETGDSKYLELYFSNFDLNSTEIQESVTTYNKAFGKQKLSFYQTLDIAYFSRQYQELVLLLKEAPDLDCITKYDISLPDEYQLEVVQIYLNQIKTFLEGHAGYKANLKIEELIKHVKQYYKNIYYQTFVKEIKIQFPERKLIAIK
ncbi:MAG: hypothetical protein IPG12_14895 [Saprospiraceae bacterium]|nr:hypothetical protein [Saprospiraceae bacterium]